MPLADIASTRVHYEIVDRTPPWAAATETVLFHHGVGASIPCWQNWLPPLQDRYRLVMYDMPGHGSSDNAGFRWTLDDMAGLLLGVADSVDAGRFHLVGESVGGTVALHTAARQPERLLSLTVSNGAHLGASIQHVQHWASLIRDAGMEGWSREMMERRFYPGAISQDGWDWYHGQQSAADPDAVLAALEVLVGTDLGPALERVTMPTLLLHPDSSPFIPVQVMADLHSRLPQAWLQVFAHARHGLPFSHGDQCAALLRDFLQAGGGR